MKLVDMDKTFKTMLVLGLAGVFTIGSVLCCCVRNIAHAPKVHACCASKAKADTKHKAGDCDQCLSFLKKAEVAKTAGFAPSLVFAFKVFPADTVFVLRSPAALPQTVWINGPPGFLSAVPFYTQFHQLRI